MVGAFPKIFSIGNKSVRDIFNSEVEVTEKVDGSQFCFGHFENTLFVRSKSKQMGVEYPDKMFQIGVDYVKLIRDILSSDLEGLAFYCEYLQKPKHNALKYDRVPKNNLVLFGVKQIQTGVFLSNIETYAEYLNIDKVPTLFNGFIKSLNDINNILDTQSFLGGSKIEGVVIKNYNITGEEDYSPMCAKFVSERFKEVLKSKIKSGNKSSLTNFIESFRTQARWDKAIQHLRDNGNLVGDPKDIGPLVGEIQEDITTEEKEYILEYLWKEIGKTLLKRSVAGFPEYYKGLLMKEQFEGDN